MINLNQIHPIGIGTFTICNQTKQKDLEGLLYSFSKGQNYIEANASYSAGEALEVVADFIKQIDRDKIYINVVMTYGCKSDEDVDKFLDYYLKKLKTTYVDCITYGATLDFLENENYKVEDYLNKIKLLQAQGKTRHIGMSNLSPEEYKKYGPFDHFEVVFGLETKVYEDNKVISLAGRSFMAYQPLRRNRTAKMNYKILTELSEKYQKSQNQIILNWIIMHRHLKVLCKTTNKSHIDENLESLNFVMSNEDYKKLDDFRSPFFDNLKVKYSQNGDGIIIHQIPNQDPLGKETYKPSYGTKKETMTIK